MVFNGGPCPNWNRIPKVYLFTRKYIYTPFHNIKFKIPTISKRTKNGTTEFIYLVLIAIHCRQTKKTIIIIIIRRRRRITEITKLKYEKRNREGERVWLPVILKMKMRKKRDSKLFTVFYSYIELALYKKIKKVTFWRWRSSSWKNCLLFCCPTWIWLGIILLVYWAGFCAVFYLYYSVRARASWTFNSVQPYPDP